MATSQASETPSTETPSPTPSTSHRVFTTSVGSTNSVRCARMSPSTRVNEEKVTKTGTSTRAATASANSIQPSGRAAGKTKTPAAGVFALARRFSDKMDHDHL